MKQTLEKAAKEYADGLYDPDDRDVLYKETQKDFVAGANGKPINLCLKSRSISNYLNISIVPSQKISSK